ncbi:tyrosine-protein phosphatase non-receptor type substrate 1-like isoform X1 [Lithobates pipiens]
MRIGLKILHIIFFLLLLVSGDFQVRGLKVTGKDVPIEALRGEDVTIPCLLSGAPIPLNLREVAVIWTLRLKDGTENDVYRFRNSHHQSLRSGSHMDDGDLQQGNARLSISNIQITDEGDYRCFVIVTRDHYFITSTLHVSVKPQIFMQYTRRIEAGYVGSVVCNVVNFYPEEVMIRWVKESKGVTTSSSLDEDVYPTKQIRNSDGTFNVSSDLTVRPAGRDEPGDVFYCIVSHKSLKKEISRYFTVPLPIKPQISMHHMRSIEDGYAGSVVCNVISFYPEDVTIRWLKQNKGFTTSSSLDLNVSPTKQIRNSDGTFNVSSDLTVRPASRDKPGDVFLCIVSHRILKEESSLHFTVPLPRRSPVKDISIALILSGILVFAIGILDTFVKKGWRPWIRVFLRTLYILTAILFCFLIYFMVDFGDLQLWSCIVLPCSSAVFLIWLVSYGKFL